MRPDELSALAAFDLLEMMFKSGVIAGRRPRDVSMPNDTTFGDGTVEPVSTTCEPCVSAHKQSQESN
jgi:hypothetical protein